MNIFGALYLYELKKIRQQKMLPVSVLIGAILVVALTVVPFFGNGYYYTYSAEDGSVDRVSVPFREVEAVRRDYLRSLSGQVLDEAMMEQMKENYTKSDMGTIQWNLNPYSPFQYLNVREDRSGASAEDFYQSQVSVYDAQAQNKLTDEERSYWKEMASGLKAFKLDYAGGWQAVVWNFDLLCLITMLLVTVGLCGSFSGEHQYRTDQLVLSSARGRNTLFVVRCSAGISYAVIVALGMFLLEIGVCSITYGLDGFSTPLQLWETGLFCALHLSIGQLTLVFLALLLLASAMTGTFVMLLSERFRTAVPAVAVPFVISGVTLLDLFRGKGRLIEQIISYLPSCRISKRTLEDYYLVHFGNIQMNSIQFSIVLYLLLTGLFGALCWQCYRNYQVTGR